MFRRNVRAKADVTRCGSEGRRAGQFDGGVGGLECDANGMEASDRGPGLRVANGAAARPCRTLWPGSSGGALWSCRTGGPGGPGRAGTPVRRSRPPAPSVRPALSVPLARFLPLGHAGRTVPAALLARLALSLRSAHVVRSLAAPWANPTPQGLDRPLCKFPGRDRVIPDPRAGDQAASPRGASAERREQRQRGDDRRWMPHVLAHPCLLLYDLVGRDRSRITSANHRWPAEEFGMSQV